MVTHGETQPSTQNIKLVVAPVCHVLPSLCGSPYNETCAEKGEVVSQCLAQIPVKASKPVKFCFG